jgi:hypothetical protein
MNPRTASTSLLLGAIRLAPRQPSDPYAVRAIRTVAASAKLLVDEFDRWFSRNSVNFVNFATAPASAAARHLANPADFA